MHRVSLLVLALIWISQSAYSQRYKEMMNDPQVNFYDVVKEADAWFATHDKGKGSGWKGYQRWKNSEEGHYYPSGDRSTVSPYFVENAYRSFLNKYENTASRNAYDYLWDDLGPYNANTVTSHYSQGIGRVESFYVDPANSQKLFLGSRSGGFWRSTDGGQNWEVTTDTLVASGVNSICVSPTHKDSVWINVRNAKNNTTHGIYLSTDGGMSWKQTPFNPQNLGFGGMGSSVQVYFVALSPHDPQLMLVGASNGLYRSTNRLNTWTRIHSSSTRQIAFHPTDPQVIYVYSNTSSNRNFVLRSSNAGASFTKSATIPGNNNNSNGRLSTSPVCADCVWYSSNNGVWRSKNEGADFTFLSNPGQSSGGFAVSDLDTNRMIYGYVDVTATSNGGQNFNQVTWWSTGNPNHNINTNYVHADLRIAQCINGVFYIGTDGYLAKSTDGGTSWTRLNDGTGIRENYRVGVSQSVAGQQICGSQDNGTSILKPGGWIEWNGGDGMEGIIHPLNDNWMVGSWQYGNRQRTKDGGQSRHSAAHGGDNDWIAPMFFDPKEHMTLYGFGEFVYKSTNFGSSWSNLGTTQIGKIKHAAIAENNPNIWVMARYDEMILTTDGGQTLQDISHLLPTNRSISDIAFDPLDDNTLVLVYDNYRDENQRVYISHNLGQTWTNISYNLSAIPATTVVIDHTNDHYIYVGGEIGVYYMGMQDTVWQLFHDGLPNTSVRDLEIQYGSNSLLAATWGRGLWRNTLMGRVNYPKIQQVTPTEKPTETQPVEDLPMEVEAIVAYAGNLSSVYLLWSSDTTRFNQRIELNHVQDSTWKTVSPIPTHVAGTKVYFKLYAVGDAQDTTETYHYMYRYKTCSSRPQVTGSVDKTSICPGDSVTFTASGALNYSWDHGVTNGQPFTPNQTQTYTVTGRNADHCAGTDQVTVTLVQPDMDVQSGFDQGKLKLTVDESAADSYQWLSCDHQMGPIGGANSQSYVVSQSGSYAVEVTKAGCVDTSLCKNVVLGLDESTLVNRLKVYPNPGSGKYTFEFGQQVGQLELILFDLSGKEVARHSAQGTQHLEWNVEHLANGVYTLKIEADGELGQLRLIKE
ncbi:T9SS type A sorting domain-containing protein [bacterium SCSIO 12741]|nr:T9SS type A sorting domain-containing protein [bacterium SCSIO 12741]